MAGPILTRVAANHPVIAAAVRAGVQEAVDHPDTAITQADAPIVTAAVTAAVTPIVQQVQARADQATAIAANATNSEPWWKSRIWIGILTAAVGYIAAKFHYSLTPDDQNFLATVGPMVIQGLGLGVAAIGRAIGDRKGPIVWSHPLTIFGIGT